MEQFVATKWGPGPNLGGRTSQELPLLGRFRKRQVNTLLSTCLRKLYKHSITS